VIDEIRVAVTALRVGGVPDPGDLQVLPLEGTQGVMVGLDDSSRPHLLLSVAEVPADLPASDIATLDVAVRSLVVGNDATTYLDVACLFESVAEVFEHFIVAVLDRLSSVGERPDVALSAVLEKWRQFLVPAEGPPGRDKLAALLAELLVLVDLTGASPSTALQAWVGPFGGRHDFRRAGSALEVKSTRSHTGRRVTIHGEDQLEAPENGELLVHLVRLEHVAGAGHSVASVVDELLAAGVRPDDLFEGLAAGGLAVSELSATAEVRFDVRERLTVPVDETSARIVPSSFVGGARPVGVVDLSYVIDLDHILDRALDDEAYGKVIRRLAGPI
jgi:hypothetical protein